MGTFEFTLVIEGLSVDDPEHDQRLAASGAEDAMLFEQDGATYAAFYRDAPSAWIAVVRAVDAIQDAYPLARVMYLDPDLVSTSDVAQRVGLTRQAVGLYVSGARGPGTFPRPEGVVSNGQRVWRWAAVREWFVTSKGVRAQLEDDALPVPVDEALALQSWLCDVRRDRSAARMMTRSLLRNPPQEAASRMRFSGRSGSAISSAHWVVPAKGHASYTPVRPKAEMVN